MYIHPIANKQLSTHGMSAPFIHKYTYTRIYTHLHIFIQCFRESLGINLDIKLSQGYRKLKLQLNIRYLSGLKASKKVERGLSGSSTLWEKINK